MTTAALLVAIAVLAPEVGWAQQTWDRITYEPIGCVVSGQYPLLDAVIEPSGQVVRARVHFKSPPRNRYEFVEMTLEGDRFVAKLPQPKLEASPLTYFIRATTVDGATSQTSEVQAQVVGDASQCPEGVRVAPVGRPSVVTVRESQSAEIPVAAIDGAGIALAAWFPNLRLGAPQKASLMLAYVVGREGADDYSGLLLAAEPGLAGGKLSVGYSLRRTARSSFESYAAKITVLRTWNDAWLADARTTYLGAEASASVWFLRPLVANLGALRRVSARAGRRDWVMTFGLGLGW